jgi:hypothetical protein
MTRRGVTLVELLVAGLLAAFVLGFALSALVGLQRAVQRDLEHGAASTTLLTASHLLRSELGDLDPAAGDLPVLESGRLVYRALRATGVACGLAADGILVPSASYRGVRLPSAGRDSVALLPADHPGAWLSGAVNGPARGATCPDGRVALAIPLDPVPAAGAGSALRLFEIMELRLYASGGEWWLGIRSVTGGETIQPVAGPFVPGGFRLAAVDTGGVRTVQADMAAYAGMAQAAGGAARSGGAPVTDSLRVVIGPLGGWP